MSDPYANLLGHLSMPNSSIPLPAFQASIACQLANHEPSPTPLAATVVDSRVFSPPSHEKLQIVQTAFRHAVHLKFTALKDVNRGLFAPSLKASLKDWCTSVFHGIQRGYPIMRLACAGGLLLGLQDQDAKSNLRQRGARGALEDEVIVALAEILGSPTLEPTAAIDSLSLALILASQTLPCVSSTRMKALPLPALAKALGQCIESSFHSGAFLHNSDASITMKDGQIHILSTSSLAKSMEEMTSSPLMSHVPHLSKLLARVLPIIVDSKPQLGFKASSETLDLFEAIASRLEADWVCTQLSDLPTEEQIAPDTREHLKTTWTSLKTLLFSTIMVVDAALSTSVYIPPSNRNTLLSPADVALQTLRTLSHLSFVISQFGGVTSTSENSFTELKRVVYLALDIISADSFTSDKLVHSLCMSEDGKGKATASSEPFRQAKKAYVLASIEQLIPVLSNERIKADVFLTCLPHLSDPIHRETFESSHSVVLAIFAARAGKSREEAEAFPFAERLVPFYSRCLIENSGEGGLSTSQLGLAYSALVRSASQSKLPLARFCIQELLSAASTTDDDAHVHRLHLTLVACVPSLSLDLLPWILGEIKGLTDENKAELGEALFEEILERVGDGEKAFGMEWWYENRSAFGVTKKKEISETRL